jgi:copper chaperone CopZ
MGRSRASTGERAKRAMGRHNFIVPDINCEHCSKTIEGTIAGLADAEVIEVNLDAKRVKVEGKASREAVIAAIESAGYEVEAVFEERSPRAR